MVKAILGAVPEAGPSQKIKCLKFYAKKSRVNFTKMVPISGIVVIFVKLVKFACIF